MRVLITCWGVNRLQKINLIEYVEHTKVLRIELDGKGEKDFIEIDPNNWANSSARVMYVENDGEVAVREIEVRIGSNKYNFIDFSLDEVEELVKGEGLE